MAANNDFPRFHPLKEQKPNNQRLGIEILLGFPEHMPQQEMTPLPDAPMKIMINSSGCIIG